MLAMGTEATKVLIIAPRFHAYSFWSLKKACELAGAKYPTAPLGLLTVAALLPSAWEIRFVDRNAEELEPANLDWADLIMTGGMLPQQRDILNLIDMAGAHGKPIVVGGADITSSPHVYTKADFRVIGEAELVIDDFVAAWQSGKRKGVFEAAKFQADVTKTPIPRYDLLNFKNYVCVDVQFSRGCPFNCEFCDIIELFGRVPRAKAPAQVLAELDRLYELGYRGHVEFVDDNLIGNKKALRRLIPELIAWQKARNYPFAFSTEASVNLSDDDQLLRDLQEANFFMIFVGIESPDTGTLVSMQKKQNTRRSLVQSVQKINEAGIFVIAGFIVGFDNEQSSTASGIIEYIEAVPLPLFMLSLLYALPNTQLTRRLTQEGRLHVGHELAPDASIGGSAGLNFETKRSRREILSDYKTILEQGYSPETFFERLRRLIHILKCPAPRGKPRRREVITLLRLIWHMTVTRPELRGEFLRTLFDCLRFNPRALGPISTMILAYTHFGPFSRFVIGRLEQEIAAIDAGQWDQPRFVALPPLASAERELAAPLVH
jgi:radical SAM superfamily enzyme YgiQ (UPF0313 family)